MHAFLVFAGDMVLKKSKHGLNTGNTLRSHVKHMLEICRHGTVQFTLDIDAINHWINRVHYSIFDSNSTSVSFRGDEFELMLTLTRFMECHSRYEMEDNSVEYSLNKLQRWSISEYWLTYFSKMYKSLVVPGFSLRFKAKESFGNWYSREFVSVPLNGPLSEQQKQHTQRKNLPTIHPRGIQRKWRNSIAKQCSVISKRTLVLYHSDTDDEKDDSSFTFDCKPTSR